MKMNIKNHIDNNNLVLTESGGGGGTVLDLMLGQIPCHYFDLDNN